MKELNMMVDEV